MDAKPADRIVVAALIMTGLLFVFILLLGGLFLWQGQRDARAAVEARAVNAAYAASTHVRWLIEANLQALRRVADSMRSRPDLFRPPTALDLDEAIAALPGSVAIWVFDENGDSVLTNEPGLPTVKVAERDYFIALRDGAEWHIGPLMTGAHSGRKLFPIGRRIERDGRFVGAAIIYVPADLLAQFWASMDLGAGSTIGLIRDDGWLVARYPIPERTLNLSNYVLFTKHIREASEGFYAADASPADGVARIVGYRRVEGLPLVTVVGVPSRALVDDFWRRLGEILLAAAPVALALAAVSLWIFRLLRQERNARHALADALERNQMLFREIHHRVKNNLQTVSALVQLQPGPAEAKEELMNRIAAMAAVHEHIYGADEFERVDIAQYIRRLVRSLQEGHGSGVTIEHRLTPLTVAADQALPLGLIVNEVVSNAFKHAFPDGRTGRITVALEAVEKERAVLRVQDDGVGWRPGRKTGMGTRLIRGLTERIDGSYEFRNEGGTLFVLTFPLG